MRSIATVRNGLLVVVVFVLSWHPAHAQETDNSREFSGEASETLFSSLVLREGIAYAASEASAGLPIRPFTGRAVCRRETGQMWLSGEFSGGKPNGQWQLWHENQSLSMSAVLVADGISSQHEAQSESIASCELMEPADGADRSEIFVNLTTSGFKQFYDNGRMAAEGSYLNGAQDGLQSFWYADGKPRMQYTYESGKLDGWFRYWYVSGQLQEESAWRAGEKEGVTRRWYENGQLHEQTSYSAGKQEGPQKTWYRNGQLLREATYRDNELNGVTRTWNENGRQRTEAHHHRGERNGPRRLWYASGQLAQEINYKNGEQSSCESWTRAGNPVSCGTFPPSVD